MSFKVFVLCDDAENVPVFVFSLSVNISRFRIIVFPFFVEEIKEHNVGGERSLVIMP